MGDGKLSLVVFGVPMVCGVGFGLVLLSELEIGDKYHTVVGSGTYHCYHT